MSDTEQMKIWEKKLANKNAQEILAWVSCQFSGKVIFASSLGAEDQVITHMVAGSDLRAQIPIFVLDTGRHFQETYALLAETRAAYGVEPRIYFPETSEVERHINGHGPQAFRRNVALRKECCFIRKVKPLRRALAGNLAWITGLRRGQSANRDTVAPVQWDAGNKLYKINPLWNWSEKMVWDFIKDREVPYNALHDQGFPSIGCAPCTRAVSHGEDPRSGRWWWEEPGAKECGLHLETQEKDGQVAFKVRRKAG